jgi:hypothetical protein
MALRVDDGLPEIETASDLVEALKTEWSVTTMDASKEQYELGRLDDGANLDALEIEVDLLREAIASDPGMFRAAIFATPGCGATLHIFHISNLEASRLAFAQDAKVTEVQW